VNLNVYQIRLKQRIISIIAKTINYKAYSSVPQQLTIRRKTEDPKHLYYTVKLEYALT
jgi:hypothetical protein